MKFIPNTTCRRCHRQYPSFRGRCPYCGTKKTREVRSATPQTDSAVPGTRAARSAAEAVNFQMLIGSVLLVAVIVVTIIMVSVNVGRDAAEQKMFEEQQAMIPEQTIVPAPTATPEPTPTPPPAITRIAVYLGDYGTVDYLTSEANGFSEQNGDVVRMRVSWFPQEVAATPEWYAETDGVVEFTPDNEYCDITLVGGVGSGTWVHVRVNEMDGKFYVYING